MSVATVTVKVARQVPLLRNTLFDIKPLHRAIEAVYALPLQEAAKETLNRDLRTGVTDEKLADLVLALHEEDRLCVHEENAETREPRIICSLGIVPDSATP